MSGPSPAMSRSDDEITAIFELDELRRQQREQEWEQSRLRRVVLILSLPWMLVLTAGMAIGLCVYLPVFAIAAVGGLAERVVRP